MKIVILWLAILGVGIGVAMGDEAQKSAPMWGGDGMMGQSMMGQGGMGGGMMGGNARGDQGGGDAVSHYSNLCATCHGSTGKGDGPAAGALFPKPTDFADCQRMAKISDETLAKSIHSGGQSVGLSPIMPLWSGSLTDQQIHELVGYIRSFCKK